MKDLAIVIVTWNAEQTIKDCLDSLIKSSIDKEIIVVDNDSQDKTVEIVKKYKEVKLIRNKENAGYGRGNNIGAKNSDGRFILILNPDAKVKEKAVGTMLEAVKSDPKIGVVGPQLLNKEGEIQREIAHFPTFFSQVPILLRLHRIPFFQSLAYPDYDYERAAEAEHLMGAALMIRREAFERAGGFDERFFLWFDETDLLKRIKEKGFKIIYFPAARVTHLTSQSIKKIDPLKRQAIWNASLRYYFSKHRPVVERILIEPFMLAAYIPAFVNFLKGKMR